MKTKNRKSLSEMAKMVFGWIFSFILAFALSYMATQFWQWLVPPAQANVSVSQHWYNEPREATYPMSQKVIGLMQVGEAGYIAPEAYTVCYDANGNLTSPHVDTNSLVFRERSERDAVRIYKNSVGWLVWDMDRNLAFQIDETDNQPIHRHQYGLDKVESSSKWNDDFGHGSFVPPLRVGSYPVRFR